METLSRHGDPLHPGLVFPVGSVDSLVAANGASIAPLDDRADLMAAFGQKRQKRNQNPIVIGEVGISSLPDSN
jgi:hypothetical protein